MKTVLHIGTLLVSVMFLLVVFIFFIPNLLSLFDTGVRDVTMDRYYLAHLLKYDKGMGVVGITMYMGACAVVIWFNRWATKVINGR